MARKHARKLARNYGRSYVIRRKELGKIYARKVSKNYADSTQEI